MAPELEALFVGDPPDTWRAAGFAVDDDGACQVGQVTIRLGGEGSGMHSWALRGVDPGDVDGIATLEAGTGPAVPADHPNGVLSIDHVVALTSNLDRTVAALEATGMELRRTRRDERLERPRLQAFFRIGEPILEVIGPEEPRSDKPARLFGLAYTVGDLEATAEVLGEDLGAPKDAVQEGRRIATLRHEPLGLSVATAFMSA